MRRSIHSIRAAFTLVELLVSMAITTMLIVVIFQIISSTQQTLTRTKAQMEAYRDARSAFESMARQLSQATLNGYWDYDDITNPKLYLRRSELHYVSGPGEKLIGTGLNISGHAVFFQGPLGYANVASTDAAAGLTELLNALGYYAAYNSDIPQRPVFLQTETATNPEKKRFRLMAYRQSSDKLSLYQPDSGTPPAPLLASATSPDKLYAWFRSDQDASSQTLADNILAVFIQPQLPASSVVPTDYLYDTRAHQLSATPLTPGSRAAQSRHQLPPVLKLTLIALEEKSWGRMSATAADQTATALMQMVNTTLFQNPANFDKDLASLETELDIRRLGHHVFSTSLAIRSAKWVSLKE